MQSVTSLSPEREAVRAANVGGSEIAALFNLHPHLTAFELWMQKSGHLPLADLSGNSRVEAGIFMEPAIAAWVQHRTGWNVRKVEAYAQHPTVAGMGASPDYEADGHPTREGVGTVQIKNVDAIQFLSWVDSKPPLTFLLQVQHEIACGGYEWGALAVCIGGNRLEVFEYNRHAKTIARIEAAVTEFWRTVREGIEPVPDFERDLETIQALYSSADSEKVVDLTASAAFADACARYVAASEEIRAKRRDRDAAKAELLTLIQDAAVAIGAGFKLSASNNKAGTRVFRCSADKPKREG